jgi:hypothetical protein
MELKKEDINAVLAQASQLFPAIAALGIGALMLPDSIATALGLQDIRSRYLGWLVAATAGSFLLAMYERLSPWYIGGRRREQWQGSYTRKWRMTAFPNLCSGGH